MNLKNIRLAILKMQDTFATSSFKDKMYKAVFIDIDGTLIKSDHSVSGNTIATIQKLKEKNILVGLVSARPLHGILPISKKLGLLDFPVASLNGAYIAVNGEVIFESGIDLDTTALLHKQLLQYNTTLIYYQQLQWFSETPTTYTVLEQRITDIPVTIQPFAHTLQHWQNLNTGPNKILVVADPVVIADIQYSLKPLYHGRLNMYTSKPIYLEVMNKAASKANAIEFLMSRYHIKREDTIAIGDNFNDREMIEFAGTGIAMGNAPNEVKAAADYVTDTNNNDGVHKALIKFIGL